MYENPRAIVLFKTGFPAWIPTHFGKMLVYNDVILLWLFFCPPLTPCRYTERWEKYLNCRQCGWYQNTVYHYRCLWFKPELTLIVEFYLKIVNKNSRLVISQNWWNSSTCEYIQFWFINRSGASIATAD